VMRLGGDTWKKIPECNLTTLDRGLFRRTEQVRAPLEKKYDARLTFVDVWN